MSRLSTLFIVLLSACGANNQQTGLENPSEPSVEDDLQYSAEDFKPRGVLSRADFTTAVDPKRFRPIAPISNEFEARERTIYLVGRLKNIPADSTIEVHWLIDASPEPLLVSEIQGSENYQFVASFQPTGKKFIRGSYTAKVMVDGSEVGSRCFFIRDDEVTQKGVRVENVKFSTKLNQRNNPVKPNSKFKGGVRKIFVSFNVNGADINETAEVQWKRSETSFHSEGVILSGDKRYNAHIQSEEGLPAGQYSVEIFVRGEMYAQKSFTIGNGSSGPCIETVALGLALNENNMPRKRMSVFSRNTPVIQCGLRFLDLEPDSEIQIHWVQVDDEGEYLRYTSRSTLTDGGSGSMGAAWTPNYELEPGEYRAKVLINGEEEAEESFRVE